MNTNQTSPTLHTKIANLCTVARAILRMPCASLKITKICVLLAAAMHHQAHAADVIKDNNSTALNDTSSWVGGAVPGTSDVAVWNSTVTTANTVSLGADLGFGGIKITNPGGIVTINAGNILSLGSSGIDMASATRDLVLASTVNLTASQTWQVGSGRYISSNTNANTGAVVVNNLGNNLAINFSAVAGAATNYINLGNLTGSGNITVGGNQGRLRLNGSLAGYTGNLFINDGATLRAGASSLDSALGTGASALYLNSGLLDLRFSSSKNFSRNTTIGGNFEIHNANSANNGTMNYTFGTLSIGANTLTVTANGTTSSGNVTFGATTLNGNAIFNVGSRAENNLVLGSVGGSFGLTKNGIGTLQVNGTSTYSGATIVNAGTLVVGVAGAINSSSSVSIASGATLTNSNTTTPVTSALILNSGASLSGSGAFAPVSMTLVANLTGGNGSFTSIAAGLTSLTKAGAMEFTLSNITDGNYVVFTGSALAGSFNTISVGGVALLDLGAGNFGGAVGGFDYAFTNSTNTLGITTVPEPSTWALMGVGAMVLILRGVRSRRASVVKAS